MISLASIPGCTTLLLEDVVFEWLVALQVYSDHKAVKVGLLNVY